MSLLPWRSAVERRLTAIAAKEAIFEHKWRLTMDEIDKLRQQFGDFRVKFDEFVVQFNTHVAASEAFKASVPQMLAEAAARAVEADDAEEAERLRELGSEIEAAAAAIPPVPQPPQFEESGN